MEEYELSVHIRDMLNERQLPEEWVWRAIQAPDQHLHVVVNATLRPKRIVTAFLD